MAWNFFEDDKEVARPPEQPPVEDIANNDNVLAKSRLWLEDWSEEDEARLRDPERSFGISWSNKPVRLRR